MAEGPLPPIPLLHELVEEAIDDEHDFELMATLYVYRRRIQPREKRFWVRPRKEVLVQPL